VTMEFDSAPRWFRWSAAGVGYLVLAIGLLLIFVRSSVKEPFLYEVF